MVPKNFFLICLGGCIDIRLTPVRVLLLRRNFNVGLAGTGATWKKPGESRGEPLYGEGLYFADRITKADEYANPFPAGPEGDLLLHSVLICRVVGGRVQHSTKNHVDKEFLRKQVYSGAHHSVLGDRS